MPFKDVMRNPENYTDQNFVADVEIFQSITGGAFGLGDSYFSGYVAEWNEYFDEYSGDIDKSIYLFDFQDPESAEYIKILEGDVVRVYGTFHNLSNSKNTLTRETSETMSLDIYYVELLQE